MSGGVDSACAALMLLKQGHQVTGGTMVLNDSDESGAAREVCGAIGIPHFIFDFRQEFAHEIMTYFAEEYAAGRTPNPCVRCNLRIKFGLFYKKTMEMGFDAMATGHYAAVEKRGTEYVLKKATDPAKDQSYVLYNLNQGMLPHILFPLGNMKKEEIRAFARGYNLPNSEKGESQDICFLPNGGHGEFIGRWLNRDFPPGRFIDTEGHTLGEHRGIIHYTIGQRKGLGVSHAHPLYVLDKDMIENTVTLGDHDRLLRREIHVGEVNWISGGTAPKSANIRTRYHQKEIAAELLEDAQGNIKAVLENGIRAPAPGQSAVFYDDDILLGGGIIL